MLRHQHLVAQMQNVLYGFKPWEKRGGESLAREYAAACEAVNRRLRQAVELKRAGQQCLARAEVERAPHLLDAVAQLEFAELPEWCQRLHELSLPAPPPLAVELVAELSEGTETAPLSSLLKNYRLLVLACAPLPNRLLTLRCIHKLDPHHPDWHADLLALEQARVQEIESAAQQCYYTADVAGLERLRHELEDSRWLISIPTHLVERIERFHSQLADRSAHGDRSC